MDLHGRSEQQLATLRIVARILAARSENQRQMLLDVLHALEGELELSRGTVMLMSQDEDALVVEAARDADPLRQQNVSYRSGEGITGRVFETGRSVAVPSVDLEPALRNRIHSRPTATVARHSFLCVPVVTGAGVAGTLSVDLEKSDEIDLDEELRFLEIVAAMIGGDLSARRRAKRDRRAYEEENLRLRDALGERFRPENIMGNSRAMRDVYTRIFQVAPADTTVLIRGESGTGKELAASAIHYTSARAKQPFVKVNCAALNENLVESELFGHEKGAFTGAQFQRRGRIEDAEGGTLFLDEIGDFSATIQVKLLRVLQEREFEPVGSNETRKANVRVIAATNRDLEAAVSDGTFRQDLFYRINVFPIRLPALRERRDDVLLLADHFVTKHARAMGKRVHRISTPAINMLMAYHWPGNVRELENCIEHAVLLSKDGVIHGHSLPPTLQTPNDVTEPAPGSLPERVRTLEVDMITDAIKRTRGNVTAAARQLGITPRQARYKIKTHDIQV